MLDKYRKLQTASVTVGIIDGKTYPDGTSVAQVGFDNEYGVPERRVPARPFFRTAIKENQAQIREMFPELLKKNDVATALGLVGSFMADALQESVMTWQEPPNAQSTIDAKGYNAPLRANDRILRNSFSFKVSEHD